MRKYEHAKKVIHELQRHEQFLAVQLQERDYEYNSHLGLLRDRVLQLENELATTQKYAGIPIQLPYQAPLLNGELSPPELLKQPPVSGLDIIPVWETYWIKKPIVIFILIYLLYFDDVGDS